MEIKLELKSNAKAPGISRSRVSSIRNQVKPRYEDLRLLVSELVSNSVRHSRSGPIVLAINTSPSQVTIEVTDGGPCFDIDHPRGDGRGLDIVDRLADEWGVESDDKCTVWVRMKLRER